MREKQLIERALPFSGHYLYQGITRGSMLDGDTTPCANCGAILATFVTVMDAATRKVHHIGTDCADTLTKAGAMYDGKRMYEIDLYAYNKAARVATEIRKGHTANVGPMFTTVLNDKDKQVDAYTADLRQYFPSLLGS